MKNVTFNYPCFHYYNYMSIQKLQITYGENAVYINIGIHFYGYPCANKIENTLHVK